MRLNTVDLKNAFLAICARKERVDVASTSEYDGKQIQVKRSYTGVPTPSNIRKSAIQSSVPIEELQHGGQYFHDAEIAAYLNVAWERLHLAKTKEIQKSLLSDTSVTELDGMLQEHGTLYKSSPLIEALNIGTGGLTFGQSRFVEKSMDSSMYFAIPKECERWGNSVVISVNLEGFPSTNFSSVEPDWFRACRFVNSGELAAVVNLANNSRYMAGAMCRVRMYMYRREENKRCIEVFHKKGNDASIFDWFGSGKRIMIAFTYIEHPMPITENDFDENNNTEKRMIEVDYGYSIAMDAAALALGLE